MLSIGTVAATGAAATYFADIEVQRDRADYYVDEHGHPAERHGRWAGHLLASLGVAGHVTLDHLLRWFDGRHPLTGAMLGKWKHDHVAGWDETFSAPKSVSATRARGTPLRRPRTPPRSKPSTT